MYQKLELEERAQRIWGAKSLVWDDFLCENVGSSQARKYHVAHWLWTCGSQWSWNLSPDPRAPCLGYESPQRNYGPKKWDVPPIYGLFSRENDDEATDFGVTPIFRHTYWAHQPDQHCPMIPIPVNWHRHWNSVKSMAFLSELLSWCYVFSPSVS